ncbi:uncharacterized protein LOC133176067 [Saccostrea echinata]|uniref:uncharacterized protein LOC133176067 n=1 Tax=Saccostrea echinata TaxID=191078 RepID=UPI002A80C0EC|nr:uncharacterized protein LOC133176067 [Saccostrea echinata]
MVYRLKPVDICASAYCFELSKDCVSDVPSDLLVSYHNVSWKEDIDGVITNYVPSVNLKCSFTPLADTSLFYEITWYVDNEEVVKSKTLAHDSLEDAILSSEHILNKQKKSGSMIYCLVGAKYKEKDIACKTGSSPLFFAGIKVTYSK